MTFPASLLDEIKSRLPLSSVVGTTVKLKRSGREWAGLSPFQSEKTASFYVNDVKRFFHCFSSGKHGDAFDFLIETEGLTFPEAVERLADLAGVALPEQSRAAVEQDRRARGLQELCELATAFFEAQLRTADGKAARAALDARGLDVTVRETFRLGYAPAGRDALKRHLLDKGATVEGMLAAGLLIEPEAGGAPFDRFRDRIMWPIHNLAGKVVSFSGRAMSADARAKYLNGPETELFEKGRLLFNWHRARKAAHERGAIIVVEGNADVTSMHAVGFAHTVAPLGTALTAEQLALLWRSTDEVVLCFDGDRSGRKAALRAVETALPTLQAGKVLRIAVLPDGQDPDDMIRAGNLAALGRLVDRAVAPLELLWQAETSTRMLDTAESRAALEKHLRAVVDTIADPLLRRHYQNDLRSRLARINPVKFVKPKPSSTQLVQRPAMPTVSPRLQGSRLFGGKVA